MSEDTTNAPSKAAPPMPRRWSIGLNVAVQVVLILGLFFGVNRISYRYHTRWDLSPQKNFTLSSATLNYLDKLAKDVSISNVIPRDGQLFGETQTLLEEYRLNGRGRVKVRSIDPLRDIERAESLKTETGLALDQSGVVVRCGKRVRFIPEEELVIREKGTETQRTIKEYRGEDSITSALINVVEGDERKFYIVVGKGARTEAALVESMLALGELGRAQNFQLFPINLAEVSAVPEDADGLIVAGLRYDLSEREINMLKAYWGRQRAGLLIMLDPSGETPRLGAFLGLNGVFPRGDRVLYAESTGSGARKEFSVQAIFDNASSITRHLAASTTTLPGQSESLELHFDDEYLKNQNINVHPLIGATDRYWGEKNYLEDLPVADEEDVKKNVFLAASVERGSITDERLRVDSCRMVIVGNAALLDKQSALAVNRDFISASLNWILNREKLIGITPKPKRNYRIQLTQKQGEIIFWSTTLVMPAIVLCLGLMVWASRRAA